MRIDVVSIFPGLPRAARPLARRQGARRRAARPARARPARLDHRPAPHGRRHALRRRRRHGHAPRRVGDRARRRARRRAPTCSSRRRRASRSRSAPPRRWPPSSTWSSRAAATRASTRASPSTTARVPACASPSSPSATTCSTGERSRRSSSSRPSAACCRAWSATRESLVEESHGAAGLLEYPVYTKPPAWSGLEIPEVLLSGHHARIERWRRDQALRRTAARRPDMLVALDPAGARQARPRDARRTSGWSRATDGRLGTEQAVRLPARRPAVADSCRWCAYGRVSATGETITATRDRSRLDPGRTGTRPQGRRSSPARAGGRLPTMTLLTCGRAGE